MDRCVAGWESLRSTPAHWLVTGVAGFIGSHVLEALLRLDQTVTGLDNLVAGSRANLDEVRSRVAPSQWARFRFREGDIRDPAEVAGAMSGVGLVLHLAALGSVPASLEQPRETHAVNVTGFLEVLEAARAAGVRRVVYASSSAVYGDAGATPSREGAEGRPLSPYALSKVLNEQYAGLFRRCYGLDAVGLRYFNVCGPRQSPGGAYAAVIPRWIDALLSGRPVEIYGDGETSRDFCPVVNVVDANLRAATADLKAGDPAVFNVGLGGATSLNRLAALLRAEVARWNPAADTARPCHRAPRSGEVRHSCADTARAESILGFRKLQTLEEGLAETVAWHGRRRGGSATGT